MARFRVIPTLLTDGVSLVKGIAFDSWRTVGSVEASVSLFEARDVDEILLLDVRARRENRTISLDLVKRLSVNLRLPLTVGGGIDTVRQVGQLIDGGADRVVLGTSAVSNPDFLAEAVSKFGSQAISCAIDYRESLDSSVFTHSGSYGTLKTVSKAVEAVIQMGCGEILLQSIEREGKRDGFDIVGLESICRLSKVPVVVSGGYGNPQDAAAAFAAGAAGVGIGSAFQFTPETPKDVMRAILRMGVSVREVSD